MPGALFEFFEIVAEELSADGNRVIVREDLRINNEESPLLDALKREMKASSTEEAVQKAVDALRIHFEAKGSRLPFDYDPTSGRFSIVDGEFLKFVREMSSIRSLNIKSRNFECTVAQWLGKRATGNIHRVGHPRDTKKSKAAFNEHLRSLGFERPVLLGRDKDGGFDILWVLPLGTVPHRPFVSVQCKNGLFNMGEADKSVNTGSRSLSQHAGLQERVHVPCVLFNDYIYPGMLTRKQLNFVPLGLTDLAAMVAPISLEMI